MDKRVEAGVVSGTWDIGVRGLGSVSLQLSRFLRTAIGFVRPPDAR